MLTDKWIWHMCEGKSDFHKNVIDGKKINAFTAYTGDASPFCRSSSVFNSLMF